MRTHELLPGVAGFEAGMPVLVGKARQRIQFIDSGAGNALAATDPVGAATLRRASTHWLRHSAASHQADTGTDIRFIQRNLRHASIETTGLYLHAEDDRRHAQTTDACTPTNSAAQPDDVPA